MHIHTHKHMYMYMYIYISINQDKLGCALQQQFHLAIVDAMFFQKDPLKNGQPNDWGETLWEQRGCWSPSVQHTSYNRLWNQLESTRLINKSPVPVIIIIQSFFSIPLLFWISTSPTIGWPITKLEQVIDLDLEETCPPWHAQKILRFAGGFYQSTGDWSSGKQGNWTTTTTATTATATATTTTMDIYQ